MSRLGIAAASLALLAAATAGVVITHPQPELTHGVVVLKNEVVVLEQFEVVVQTADYERERIEVTADEFSALSIGDEFAGVAR